jgi:hypothetical protein
MNRELIYSSLLGVLSAATGVNTVSRRLKHWADVAPADQPALFMVQKSEMAQVTTGQPTRWSLRVDIYVYVRSSGDLPPATYLNPILDAVASVLNPDAVSNGPQTLGGLVTYARIEGTIETDEGVLGDQAVAIIPVKIFTA